MMAIHNLADGERPQANVEFPSGPVPPDSNFYIERPPIEQLIYQEISKPGSVIRIKAPKQMGKSSLLLHLLHQAEQLNYRTAYLNFSQAENEIFSSLDKFLRWFSANLSRQLQIKPMLDEYWDKDIGSKVSCTVYLQAYLLEQIDTPLLLVLNEVNRLFESPSIAREFLSLLRSWYEEGKQQEILQKLRVVIAHSTEVFIELNINQSPFNIGLPIQLPEFNLEQVISLAARHEIDWTEGTEARRLMAMVGGHPYLVRLALYSLATSPQALDSVLEQAPKLGGIYSEYLRKSLVLLQKYPELATALKQAIASESIAQLDAIAAYKLESMGLVKIDGSRIALACNLYRDFFANQDFEKSGLQAKISQLEKQIKTLQRASNTDEMTKTANRSYMETYLETMWKELGIQDKPLTLILCEIDFFKIYSDFKGRAAADDCLKKIAAVLCDVLNREEDLVSRYNWEQFMLVLPGIDEEISLKIAKKIRSKVEELAIPYDLKKLGGFPSDVISVSLGVTSTIPNPETYSEILIQAANAALYKAKLIGRDRTQFVSIFSPDMQEIQL